MEKYGLDTHALHDPSKLHTTLELILDNEQPRLMTEDVPIESERFNPDIGIYANLPTELVDNTEKGQLLSTAIQRALPESHFRALVNLVGGIDRFLYLLGESNLKSEDIIREQSLGKKIFHLGRKMFTAPDVQRDYDAYRRGYRVRNPVQVVDNATLPIVQRVITDMYREGAIGIQKRMLATGFSSILSKEEGLGRIVRKVAPDLVHKIPSIVRWRSDDDAVDIALRKIQEVLYTIPEYKEAEETENRGKQVEIINRFVTTERAPTRYFMDNGLQSLMNRFIDPTGEKGFKKAGSPKAVLMFYSEKKGLNWFDRTQEKYVQEWRFNEKGMWDRGEESVRLALDAVQDALYTLPGYRNAEQTGNRDEQCRIINDLLKRETAVAGYFVSVGLRKVFDSFGRPTRDKKKTWKKATVTDMLRLYSDRKNLSWFDRQQPAYVQIWRVLEPGMFMRGEKTTRRAIEAIEDVLYKLPDYREAESSRNRDQQLEIIGGLLSREKALGDFFREQGLDGVLQYVIRSSPAALVEFYSTRKELGWFDQNQSVYLTTNSQGRLQVVNKESTQ
ncbi:hypothetical protein HYV80_05260 [Candidatus Woesearchaeota archaeon]|nr:hypothetical protein [Candidatus Woesearchaeota archaeon]